MQGVRVLEAAIALPDLEQRFVELVRGHRDRARRTAWRLVGGDNAAAEDVTQDAFVAAYRGLPRFRGDASLETWFYRILIRQAHSHRRWRRVREALSGPIRSDEAPDPNPAGAGDPALRRRIGAALEALSSHQRDAFVLVHLEGFTVSETAAILGKAEGTIKSHLHRALSGLRRTLGDLRDGAGDPKE